VLVEAAPSRRSISRNESHFQHRLVSEGTGDINNQADSDSSLLKKILSDSPSRLTGGLCASGHYGINDPDIWSYRWASQRKGICWIASLAGWW
jgi:hypothetical protein